MGYVHRDLKPGNVMWLPRENHWTLIDFACVARTGEAARLGFSMAYAAPEVIAAYRRNDGMMIAQVLSLSMCKLASNPRIVFVNPVSGLNKVAGFALQSYV